MAERMLVAAPEDLALAMTLIVDFRALVVFLKECFLSPCFLKFKETLLN
jgi:hypothetical protein